MKDQEYYFHQSPPLLCKDIISNIPFNDDDILLEPFAGENNFFDEFPEELPKYRCEIEDGFCFKDFDYEGIKPTTIITNPPFRIDGKNAFFDILMFFAKIKCIKNIYFLCNDYCVGSLTPPRMYKLNQEGLFINKKTTINVKKWRGRYYLVNFCRTYNPAFEYYIDTY